MTTAEIKFIARHVQNGWAVFEREGSRKTGFTERQVFQAGLSMHTAQVVVATFERDFLRHGVRPTAA